MHSYEHKHQELGSTKSNTGIARMANEIAQNLFRLMAQQGMVFTKYDFNSLFSSYFDESRYAISQYAALSKINGLFYDRQKEIAATEIFMESLKSASERFLADPLGVPSLSSWSNIISVIPDIPQRLTKTVAEDKNIE
jgi:glucosyl-3-phosphoglycerate synthase